MLGARRVRTRPYYVPRGPKAYARTRGTYALWVAVLFPHACLRTISLLRTLRIVTLAEVVQLLRRRCLRIEGVCLSLEAFRSHFVELTLSKSKDKAVLTSETEESARTKRRRCVASRD